MVEKLIQFAVHNKFVVLTLSFFLFGWGIYSVQTNPIDAIPDLSENQVIVFTEWMGRSPQLIEDQITYLRWFPTFREFPKSRMCAVRRCSE